MLAGAHGIDAVLLVVAADESVMPQTREHFEICRLLGISAGPGGAHQVRRWPTRRARRWPSWRCASSWRARSWQGRAGRCASPRAPGPGSTQLRTALRELALDTPPRRADGLLRLPVDRVFTLRGFGTVATGTVVAGALGSGGRAGDPAGGSARPRSRPASPRRCRRARERGRRAAAVNLAGLRQDVARGDVLAHPGTLWPRPRCSTSSWV